MGSCSPLMGDIVTLDERGYLVVTGRTSDFIIRGAKKISAGQVEDEVASHPAVALAAALAAPDEVFGERVCVFVQLREGMRLDLADLTAHLVQRGASRQIFRSISSCSTPCRGRPVAKSSRALYARILRDGSGKVSGI